MRTNIAAGEPRILPRPGGISPLLGRLLGIEEPVQFNWGNTEGGMSPDTMAPADRMSYDPVEFLLSSDEGEVPRYLSPDTEEYSYPMPSTEALRNKEDALANAVRKTPIPGKSPRQKRLTYGTGDLAGGLGGLVLSFLLGGGGKRGLEAATKYGMGYHSGKAQRVAQDNAESMAEFQDEQSRLAAEHNRELNIAKVEHDIEESRYNREEKERQRLIELDPKKAKAGQHLLTQAMAFLKKINDNEEPKYNLGNAKAALGILRSPILADSEVAASLIAETEARLPSLGESSIATQLAEQRLLISQKSYGYMDEKHRAAMDKLEQQMRQSQARLDLAILNGNISLAKIALIPYDNAVKGIDEQLEDWSRAAQSRAPTAQEMEHVRELRSERERLAKEKEIYLSAFVESQTVPGRQTGGPPHPSQITIPPGTFEDERQGSGLSGLIGGGGSRLPVRDPYLDGDHARTVAKEKESKAKKDLAEKEAKKKKDQAEKERKAQQDEIEKDWKSARNNLLKARAKLAGSVKEQGKKEAQAEIDTWESEMERLKPGSVGGPGVSGAAATVAGFGERIASATKSGQPKPTVNVDKHRTLAKEALGKAKTDDERRRIKAAFKKATGADL